MLVTLGDRYHLDGLVAIESLVIIRCDKELARREHSVLAWIEGELHTCAGAPTRTSGEWRLSDTLAKHRRVPLSLYFEYLL